MSRVIRVNDDAFSEQTGDWEPIPVGTKLKSTVFDIKESVTGPNAKNPGAPQFMFTAKVTEDGPYKGREVAYNYIPLDPEAGNAWALTAFAEAVGWPSEKGVGVTVPDDLTEVLGTEFVAKFGQQASQKINEATGKPYINNRVTGYQHISKAVSKPVAGEKVGWENL